MNWISVKDRLPEQSGYYMTVRKDTTTGKSYRAMTEYINSYGWATFASTVTHWMAIPELPEEVTE